MIFFFFFFFFCEALHEDQGCRIFSMDYIYIYLSEEKNPRSRSIQLEYSITIDCIINLGLKIYPNNVQILKCLLSPVEEDYNDTKELNFFLFLH